MGERAGVVRARRAGELIEELAAGAFLLAVLHEPGDAVDRAADVLDQQRGLPHQVTEQDQQVERQAHQRDDRPDQAEPRWWWRGGRAEVVVVEQRLAPAMPALLKMTSSLPKTSTARCTAASTSEYTEAAQLGTVADHAHDRGVAMTFEVLNRYESALINTARQARDFVAASGSAHLRVHLDTFHMAVEEADMLGAVRETAPVLGYLELGQSGRGPLSAGSVDVEAVVRAAIGAGYGGRVGLEAFSRSVLSSEASDLLAIWREPYADGAAAEAIELVRKAEAAVGSVSDSPS
ncbi:TIM barrel protein [Modestobacter sp. SYSU DS0657]